MTDIPVTIDAGDYWLEIDCPQCGGTEHVRIELSGRLIVDDDTCSLRPRLKAKSTDHICRQLSITVTRPTEHEPLPFGADDDAEADQ